MENVELLLEKKGLKATRCLSMQDFHNEFPSYSEFLFRLNAVTGHELASVFALDTFTEDLMKKFEKVNDGEEKLFIFESIIISIHNIYRDVVKDAFNLDDEKVNIIERYNTLNRKQLIDVARKILVPVKEKKCSTLEREVV